MSEKHNMKATLEFELPAEHDAYLDAVNGTRWRQYANLVEACVSTVGVKSESPECRQEFCEFLQSMREERLDAGLSLHTSESLQKIYDRHAESLQRRASQPTQ